MAEKYTYESIPPERELEYMEAAAKAAGEAAAPVVAELGKLGVQELMPSRELHAHAMNTAETNLSIQDGRGPTAFTAFRREYGASNQPVGRIEPGNPTPPAAIG